MSSQIAIHFDINNSYHKDDFFVSSANENAFNWVNSLADWSDHCSLVCGEQGSGKTHLAHIWQNATNAVFLSDLNITKVTGRDCYIVEDIDKNIDEKALFHLYNHVKESGGKLLLTSAILPSLMEFRLADLASRINAIPTHVIDAPDDTLLDVLLTKGFSDRQLCVDKEVISYIADRIPRQYVALQKIIALIDKISMQQKRKITIPLVRELIQGVILTIR